MKTIKCNVVIDSISSVTGGWNHGFSVDASIHREAEGTERDGFETVRVALDRDRLVKTDGSYDYDAVAEMVTEKVGTVEDVEVDDH
jgi:hypothetical protein